MIQASGVSFQYAGYESPSFHPVDFVAQAGQLVLVQGENGSGKSTLLRCLAGLMPQFYPGRYQGQLWVAGLKAFSTEPREFFGLSALVSQDPRSQAFCPNLYEEIAFGLRNRGVQESLSRQVEEAAEAVGLSSFLGTSVRQLSGGQQKLALLACYLALSPQILLLDEPLANLDRPSQQRLLNVFEIEKTRGTLLVISEHQTDSLKELAEVTLTLTRSTSSRQNEVHQENEDKDNISQKNFSFRTITSKFWQAQDCTLGHTKTVFEDLNFQISTTPGLLLTGDNGAGKSTLFKALRGLLPPLQGRLDFDGAPLNKRKISHLASQIGYAGQNAEQQFFCLTVQEELEAGARFFGRYDADWLAWLKQQWGLEDLAHRSPYHLSGGEKRRLLLAATLAAQPEVLLWDEPLAGLDSLYQHRLKNLILELQDLGLSFWVTAHHDDLPLERRFHIEEGQLLA